MSTLAILSISDVRTVDEDFFWPFHGLLVENTAYACYSFVLPTAVKGRQDGRNDKIRVLTSGVSTGETKSSCFRKNL